MLKSRQKWLVTGVAGFIGSHILEKLISSGQQVVGYDNFSTGKKTNLDQVHNRVGESAWGNFSLMEGDLLDNALLAKASEGVDVIIHQAALGSVPLSLREPMRTHESNVTVFVNVLEAARSAGISRIVYASSSAVYGDCPDLPLKERSAGSVLSPYAASKWINEVYATTYARCYGMQLIGLRYFNIFGPRQDPEGAYAAVIPKWIHALTHREQIVINGDGSNTRDFCSVDDVVTANLLAATAQIAHGTSLSLNVGSGQPISLIELHEMLRVIAANHGIKAGENGMIFGAKREGDIVHSVADVTLTAEKIGFRTSGEFMEKLEKTFRWFS